MTQAEIESELVSLREQVSQLRAREAERTEKWRPIVKTSVFLAVLFGVVTMIAGVVGLWTHDSRVFSIALPCVLTAIPLNFLSVALRT